jgi:Domain of unknown function (DUF5658)
MTFDISDRNILLRVLIVVLLAALQVADVVSTNSNVSHGALELNPLVEMSMTALGAAWWLPKAGIMLLIMLGARRAPLRGVCATAALYAVVVINNLSYSLS